MRGGGLFTFPALFATIGFLMAFGGHMADGARPRNIGLLMLGGSILLLLGVIYVRRQGWIE